MSSTNYEIENGEVDAVTTGSFECLYYDEFLEEEVEGNVYFEYSGGIFIEVIAYDWPSACLVRWDEYERSEDGGHDPRAVVQKVIQWAQEEEIPIQLGEGTFSYLHTGEYSIAIGGEAK